VVYVSFQHLAVKPTQGGGNGAIVIMLALFLIMLVLFILLNAYSKPSRAKTEQAANSMADSLELSGVPGRGLSATLDGMPWSMAVQNRLAGVVHTQLQLELADVETDASTLKVTLPIATFFEGGEVAVKPGALGFLENVGAVLKGDAQGTPAVRMVVKDAITVLPLAMARAHNLVVPVLAQGAYGVTAAAGQGTPAVVLEFSYQPGDMRASESAGKLNQTLQPLGGAMRGEGR
jgi:hypothetical protein